MLMKNLAKQVAVKLLQTMLLVILLSNVLYAGVTDGGVTAFRPDPPNDSFIIFTDNPADDPNDATAPLGLAIYYSDRGACENRLSGTVIHGLVCHGSPGTFVEFFTCDAASETQGDSLWCLFSENPRSGGKAWAVKFTAGLIPTNDGESIVRCEATDTFDPATGCTSGLPGTLPTQINIDGGYLKLDVSPDGGPIAADCKNTAHEGRMIVDSANSTLYICTVGGWITLDGI